MLLSQYTIPGEPIPYLILTQGKAPHSNIPPQIPSEKIKVKFAGSEGEGTYVDFNIGVVKSMIVWSHEDIYLTCGGSMDREGLLELISQLAMYNEKG